MKRGLITWDKAECRREYSKRASNELGRFSPRRNLPRSRVFRVVAIESGAVLFEFHAVLQSRPAHHSPRSPAHAAVRAFAARLWLDSLGHDDRRRPAGRQFREAACSEIAAERRLDATLARLDSRQFPYDIFKSLQPERWTFAECGIGRSVSFRPQDARPRWRCEGKRRRSRRNSE